MVPSSQYWHRKKKLSTRDRDQTDNLRLAEIVWSVLCWEFLFSKIDKNIDRRFNSTCSQFDDTCGGVLLFCWISRVGCEADNMDLGVKLLEIMLPGHHQWRRGHICLIKDKDQRFTQVIDHIVIQTLSEMQYLKETMINSHLVLCEMHFQIYIQHVGV